MRFDLSWNKTRGFPDEREARESYDVEKELFKILREAIRAIEDVPYRLLKDPATKERLLDSFDELEDAISAAKE